MRPAAPMTRRALVAGAVTLFAVVPVALGVAAQTPAALAGSPSPTALYRALARTPVPASQLPRGLRDPEIGTSTPMGNAPAHGAIGEVDLVLNSVAFLVSYIVFPSRAAALADFADTPEAAATPL